MEAKVAGIFRSIQGEGKYVGSLQVFVRFFGCNLNCQFCDTKLKKFKLYDVNSLKKAVSSLKVKFLSLTGGEPLCQADFLKMFLENIAKDKFKVYLETNATLYKNLRKVIKYIDIISFDLKLKSSTGGSQLWKVHEEFFKVAKLKEIFFKTVITPSTQFDDIKRLAGFLKDKLDYPLYLQPDSRNLNKRLLKKIFIFGEYLLSKGVDTRILPQVHKFLKIE
ncbi:MAG: 7-carboxy-7-deazaguanine synthase QueE [Candidatus Omnitrophica bacterium]|nr:7-carboxy-7-deazaguanine synthase QueE [Candidatus Omnitrophota bacterium]